jgi:hypothetical protein
MQPEFIRSLGKGTERLMAWADVLDRINVFPVADGDTGRNLALTLSPILQATSDARELTERLLLAARGNSGNLASRFLSGFVEAAGEGAPLSAAARRGNRLAWEAVERPLRGTMLSVFDALTEALERHPPDGRGGWTQEVMGELEESVNGTTRALPVLAEAGVVDSGALGMFIFFDGFLHALAGHEELLRPIAEIFRTGLEIRAGWQARTTDGCCIDAVMQANRGGEAALKGLGESLVTIRHGEYVKVHLHADDEQAARARMAELGEIVTWAADRLDEQSRRFQARISRPQPIHLVTDAAGTVTREDAAELQITLLDSYVNFGQRSVPETLLDPGELYATMRAGVPVSTSQASDFERQQHYQKLVGLYPRILYVCVGSAFTQNFQAVSRWKREHDPADGLSVIDSGAASGRLGLVVIAAGRRCLVAASAEEVIGFVEDALRICEEYVFLDRLRYLAAGGRLSRSSAFFGEMLRMKPVVSPLPGGAKKIAVVRDAKEQVDYALQRLESRLAPTAASLLMLEHTDNEEWVREVPGREIERRFPGAEILVRPMSLTSGAHMGPGTWGLALLPSGSDEPGRDPQGRDQQGRKASIP